MKPTANDLHDRLQILTACLRVWQRDLEEDEWFGRLKRRIGEVEQMEREARRTEGEGLRC